MKNTSDASFHRTKTNENILKKIPMRFVRDPLKKTHILCV